ncbi:Uncharacterised protein [uncultured archaeon]|nr:Uncharacterised protein [uncultured archaeon]
MPTKTKSVFQTMTIDNSLMKRPPYELTIRFDQNDTVVVDSSWNYVQNEPAPRSGKKTMLTHDPGHFIYDCLRDGETVKTEIPRRVEVLEEHSGRWAQCPSARYDVLRARVNVIFKDADGSFKLGSSWQCFIDEKLLDNALDSGVFVDRHGLAYYIGEKELRQGPHRRA